MTAQKIIDLHCHSTYSDGTLSPKELVQLGKQQGLSALALTDHDTIHGLVPFFEQGVLQGLETITGVELGALWKHYHQPEIHIVGLGFHINSPILEKELHFMREQRELRNEHMAQKLTSMGLSITLEELKNLSHTQVITRAHFAKLLLKKGYISTMAEAFSKYISPGLPAYVPRVLFSPKNCIDLIHKSGGVAILAHPNLYNLSFEALTILCRELVDLGIDGIEIQYSSYSSSDKKNIRKLANTFHLLFSGGSDFHGENKPHIQLGTGKGNLLIPYTFWEDMQPSLKKYQQA